MTLWPDSEAFGHKGRVFDLAFHPHDPACLASASEDGSVRVWRADSQSSSWRQASCCFGHTDEVLRVAWSANCATLASGGADGTVRLWSPLSHGHASYASQELMVLEGHPEEVYALAFLPAPTTGGRPTAAAAAAAAAATPSAGAGAGLPPQQQALEPLLVAGSGEALFLWDLATQQLLQEVEPSSRTRHRPDWRPPIQPPPPDAAARAGATAAADDEQEDEDWAPAFVFSLAASPALHLLATSSSDGVVRLFEARASSRCLTEVAAAQAYPSDMATSCFFSARSPHQLVTSSKGGEVLLLDVRQLAAPLQHMRLPGPVLDMAVAQTQEGVEQLLLVGCDAVVRCLCWNHGALSVWSELGGPPWAAAPAAGSHGSSSPCRPGNGAAAVQGGELSSSSSRSSSTPWDLLRAPGTYTGNLLAVAASADGSRVAAAGASVEMPAGPTVAKRSSKGSSSGGVLHAVTSGMSAMGLKETTRQQESATSTVLQQQQHEEVMVEAEAQPHVPTPPAAAAAAVAGTVRRRGKRPAAAAGIDALDAITSLDAAATRSRAGTAAAAEDDLFGDLDLPQVTSTAEAAAAAAAAMREQQHNPEHHPPDGSRAPLYLWSLG